MCEVSSVEARQRTRGCSPRGFGGVLALVQGLKNIALRNCSIGVSVQCLFQPASAFLSAGLGVFRAGTATRGPVEPSGRRALRVGVLAKHVELHNRRLSIHSRVRPDPRCARSPRAPAYVKAFREPSTLVTALVAFHGEEG